MAPSGARMCRRRSYLRPLQRGKFIAQHLFPRSTTPRCPATSFGLCVCGAMAWVSLRAFSLEANKRPRQPRERSRAEHALAGCGAIPRVIQGENIADDGRRETRVRRAVENTIWEAAGEDRSTDLRRSNVLSSVGLKSGPQTSATKPEAATQHRPALAGKYRCNGPLLNTPEFKQAFNLPDDCPMVRPADQIVSIR